jgi:hypothetical protein
MFTALPQAPGNLSRFQVATADDFDAPMNDPEFSCRLSAALQT